jgi:outer membrane protein OmpA-like peptidoglycan-associated protein
MSISDMMSGLMLVFLFIAIGFMIEVESDKQKMKDIALEYRDTKVDLNEVLYSEFEDDLKKWDATITKENHIVFNSPKLLFEVNKSVINDKFKSILDSFFPRLIKVLTSNKYKNNIYEIKIEGHTSSEWGDLNSTKEKYLKNMKLSQKRAYSVLSYCYSLENSVILKNRDWLIKYLRANGISFAKTQNKKNKAPLRNRKVEFVVQLKSEDKLYKILK